MDERPTRKPEWLKTRLAQGPHYARLREIVHGAGLHTVCEEALCPNQGKCWEKGRATLLILGDKCSRSCRFCNVSSARPEAPDLDEPRRVADAVRQMGLADVVLTSVTRDDLPDGGAELWAETIRCVQALSPTVHVEVLIPDFGGSVDLLQRVMDAGPEVLGHNLETVRALYSRVRPQADYDRSLQVLERAHEQGFVTKTSIMVGCGETAEQVFDLMEDAARTGCDIFYVGQYLQPSRAHLAVERYVEPAEFDIYREKGRAAGFEVVVSDPFVRSSLHSDEQAAYVAGRLGGRR